MHNRRIYFVFIYGVDVDGMVSSSWEVYDSREDQRFSAGVLRSHGVGVGVDQQTFQTVTECSRHRFRDISNQ